ncbi:MAG: PIN domain-containing protein, partial [Myxococcota bacterium]
MRPKPSSRLSNWISERRERSFATTTITVMEVVYGLARLPNGRRREDLQARFVSLIDGTEGLRVLELDREGAGLAGALKARREELGRPAAQADMMIAGICRARGTALATRNLKDFEETGLELI